MTAVLPTPQEKHPRFINTTPDPLRHPTAQRYFLQEQKYFLEQQAFSIKSGSIHCGPPPTDCVSPVSSSVPSSIPSSPEFTPTTPDRFSSTPIPSLSPSVDDEDGPDDEILFPSYDANEPPQEKGFKEPPQPEEVLSGDASAEPSMDDQKWTWRAPAAADDTSLEDEPSRHVDYLAHEWKEEDIWASWRYVAARRNTYTNGPRLENASWRTWMKLKLNLGTVSPESLNWLKDCDVTWLYGPLKTSKALEPSASPPPSRLDTPNLYQDRKPILKKKTASETILQRSLSQHTLLQHAGAILKAKEAENAQSRPPFPRSVSGFSHSDNQTGSSTPTVVAGTPTTTTFSDAVSPNERRHIHFNNEVVQCIAVEAKDEDERDEYWSTAFEDDGGGDDSFSDDVHMVKQILSKAPVSNRSSPRNSFCHENKTIAPLPSTTLKYRGDTPEPPAGSLMERWFGVRSAPLPSFVSSLGSEQPSEPSANFLLDDDDEFDGGLDFSWQSKNRSFLVGSENDEGLETDPPGYYGESSNAGIFDRVTDTVNTARDIAHVIWNVGWRR